LEPGEERHANPQTPPAAWHHPRRFFSDSCVCRFVRRGSRSDAFRQCARRVVEDFTAAWNAHRIDSLVQLFTPNGSLATPGGGVARSRSAIRELLADQHERVFRQSSLSTRVEGVHRQGAHRAIITGAFTLDGIPAILGVEVSRQGSFRFELTRRDGEWLISSARIQPA